MLEVEEHGEFIDSLDCHGAWLPYKVSKFF